MFHLVGWNNSIALCGVDVGIATLASFEWDDERACRKCVATRKAQQASESHLLMVRPVEVFESKLRKRGAVR